MNCAHVLGFMQAFVDGELGANESRRLIAHARECASCRLLLEERQELAKHTVAALTGQRSAPANLVSAVSARVAQPPAPTHRLFRSIAERSARRLRTGLAIAGAAAIVLVTLALMRALQPSPGAVPPSVASATQQSHSLETVAPAGDSGGGSVKDGESLSASPDVQTVHPKVSLPPSQPALGEPPKQPLFAVIAARQPVVDDNGRALRVGERLPAGTAVRTGATARVTLITRRGSEFTLSANTELATSADGRSAALRSGRIYCRNRAGEFTTIATAAGRIQLLGTALDAAVKDEQTVAVTVVEGKVRLSNAHGEALVESGKQALLIASLPPESGEPVNTHEETAWYDGRGTILSDYGEIAYAIRRGDGLITEIWAMNADGTGKHLVKSYVGYESAPGPWLSGEQVLLVSPSGLIWTYPDLQARKAHTHSGHAMFHPWVGRWLLNAATGYDAPLGLPTEYNVAWNALAPDSTRLALHGWRTADPATGRPFESGIWVYDLRTGAITKALDDRTTGPLSWSPDGTAIAVSLWRTDYLDLEVAIVDVTTGDVTELGVVGAGASFSPDGTRIAYAGDFKRDDIIGENYPLSGSVFVLDLTPGAQPLRLSPVGEGSSRPQWSPDGTRVLYQVDHFEEHPETTTSVFVAAADGSGATEVYRGSRVYPTSWAPPGDAIYVSTKEGILLVAADGSGVIADVGGNVEDSMTTAAEQAALEAADAAIQEAVFQHAIGKLRAYEGKAGESSAAHRAAANIFAGLPWHYPHLGLSTSNVLVYADRSQELADRPAEVMVAESCKQHLSHLGFLVERHAELQGGYASDLAALEAWARTRPSTMDGVLKLDRDDISVMFRCPHGDSYVYSVPAPSTKPKAGDTVLSCPEHPEYRVTWEDSDGRLRLKVPGGYSISNA